MCAINHYINLPWRGLGNELRTARNARCCTWCAIYPVEVNMSPWCWQDSLAERSKAVAQGAIPKGRGFEPHSCQFSFILQQNHDTFSARTSLPIQWGHDSTQRDALITHDCVDHMNVTWDFADLCAFRYLYTMRRLYGRKRSTCLSLRAHAQITNTKIMKKCKENRIQRTLEAIMSMNRRSACGA